MLATQTQLHAVLIVFVVSLAIIDSRTHRIPNALCAVAALIGVSLQVGIHGEAGLLVALGGATVAFAMFIPFYVLRAFGAGDVKAMATAGIFLGVQNAVLAGGITLIAGAVLGLLMLWLKPAHAAGSLRRLAGLLLSPVASVRNREQNRSSDQRLRFPYGVAIACGVAVALIIQAH